MPANKTPAEIAALVWDITKANVNWGRVRVANQLALLNIFLSASTVRNIINQPEPRTGPKLSQKPKKVEDEVVRSIPAWYPNHVWSIDTTMVFCWGLWPIHICVVIDHFSRKSWRLFRWKVRTPDGRSMPWNHIDHVFTFQ